MIFRLRFFGIGILILALSIQPTMGLAQEGMRDTGGEKPLQVAQAAVPAAPEPSLISLDFKEVDIQAVLQALARKARVNVVTGKEVTGTVTLHLTDVTWEQALDAVTKMSGFGYEKDGNVILVSTMEDLKTRREAMKALVEIEPLTTKVIELRYLDAGDAKKFLEPQLSPQGRISVLEVTGQKGWAFGAAEAGGGGEQKARERRKREGSRSKAIVITDTPTTIERLEKILTKIDVMPKQILIEARVMEVNRNLLRDLGLEVGTGSSSTSINSSSGFVSSTTSRSFGQQSLNKTDGGEGDFSSFGGSALNQFLTPSIFVPQTSGLTAANTGLNLVLRRLRGGQFEMLLRALEEDVRTNTLSAPHVLTLSGQEARVLVGEKYPILNTQVSGTSTSVTTTTLDYYQDIGVELFVVPQVGGDNHIDMIIHPVVSSRNGTVGSNAYPILNTRETETQIIIESGDTIVIGGLLKDVLSKSRIGLPFLGKIPILGVLFSRNTTDVEKIDLLIFITARIVEEGSVTPQEMERLRADYDKAVREQTPLETGRSRSDLSTLPKAPVSKKPTPAVTPSSMKLEAPAKPAAEPPKPTAPPPPVSAPSAQASSLPKTPTVAPASGGPTGGGATSSPTSPSPSKSSAAPPTPSSSSSSSGTTTKSGGATQSTEQKKTY